MAPGRPARVLVADDHPVVREGVRALFERLADLRVTAEAADGLDAVAQAMSADVDLVVMDVAMPGLTGLQAIREIRRRRADLPIVLLSVYDSEQYVFEAAAAGAAGYVLKRQADRDLVEACRAALRAAPFSHPPELDAVMGRYLERGGPTGPGVLSLRESEVVKLIAEGHDSRQIADRLTISIKTVERHRANILAKLGMRDRVEVTRWAIRTGLVEP